MIDTGQAASSYRWRQAPDEKTGILMLADPLICEGVRAWLPILSAPETEW